MVVFHKWNFCLSFSRTQPKEGKVARRTKKVFDMHPVQLFASIFCTSLLYAGKLYSFKAKRDENMFRFESSFFQSNFCVMAYDNTIHFSFYVLSVTTQFKFFLPKKGAIYILAFEE